ncbi:MAG: haloalkane dehalogenase [Myxococcota bacterium]
MEFVRTSESRFESLPGYAFTPHYVTELPGAPGLRMHYIDEGPADAEHTYLCLHGEPTWAYLYRKMLPVFTEAGGRVVAPDFFGFGRSDKPVEDHIYTFTFHRNTLLNFIERLDLKRITLVCQDWGGLIGLTLPMEMPERFARVLVMNTALATGEQPPSPGFEAWKAWVATQHDLNVGNLMNRAVLGLTTDELAAYDAPFESARSKAGVRTFPQIVPVSPDMDGAALSKQAVGWWKNSWEGQSFMAIGMQDPVLGPSVMRRLHRVIRGCPEPFEVSEAGHFVQEHGVPVAQAALEAWS